MRKLKMISIIWGIVAVLLFSALTTIGFIYKNKIQKYKKAETKLVEVAKKYTSNSFSYATDGKTKIVTYNDLKDSNLIDKLEVKNKKCDGYVEVTFEGVTKYKAYVKCGEYKTHGFKSKYLKDNS